MIDPCRSCPGKREVNGTTINKDQKSAALFTPSLHSTRRKKLMAFRPFISGGPEIPGITIFRDPVARFLFIVDAL